MCNAKTEYNLNDVLDLILSALSEKKLTGEFLKKLKEENPEEIVSVENCGNDKLPRKLAEGFFLYSIKLVDGSDLRCICKDF